MDPGIDTTLRSMGDLRFPMVLVTLALTGAAYLAFRSSLTIARSITGDTGQLPAPPDEDPAAPVSPAAAPAPQLPAAG